MRPKEPIPELDLAPQLDPAGASGSRQRRPSGHARALDDHLDTVQQPFVLTPCVHFDAPLGKPPGVDPRVAVGGDHLDPAARQGESRRLARPREPDDEDAAGELQRRKNVKSR
jgi:hypothetical protein